MLVWLTQLGLSVVIPPVCTIGLAVWLHRSHNWGTWVIWVGILLGVICAADGLRVSLRAMEKLGSSRKDDTPPPVAFNDHD